MCSAHSKILIAFTCSASSLCLSELVRDPCRYQRCIGKVVELSGQHLQTVWPMPEVYHNQVCNTGTSEQLWIWYSTMEQTSVHAHLYNNHITHKLWSLGYSQKRYNSLHWQPFWKMTTKRSPYKCMTNWRQNTSNLGRKYHSITATLVFNLIATFLVKQHYHIVWTC